MAFLKVLDGPNPGHEYKITNGENKLGRHPDCHIIIEVGAVSRMHAQVINKGDDFLVEDLDSRNHTFLNDEDIFGIGPRGLKHGDKIRICDVTYTFHKDNRPLPAPTVDLGSSEASDFVDTPATPDSDGSSVSAVLIDDDSSSSNSTIMSKVEVSSHRGRIQFVASPEAKLEAMIKITQSLGKSVAMDEVLPKVLDSLFKIFMQADRGFIGLRDDKGSLVPRWSRARREDQETIRVSRTIVNQVMDSQEAILSADAATDDRFEMSQSIAEFRIRSMMCAPLINSDGVSMGVLQIDTLDQNKRFQQDDLDVLASVASQAAIAIDNANMHENALQQQALEKDLALAHDVQKSFLPDKPPQLEGYDFFSYYEPANHVGGDYFDYIELPDGRIAVLVADVVGHGVAAALMMAKLSAEARFNLASESSPAVAVSKLNDRLSAMQVDRFVTMIMAVLDPKTHEVTMVNAGHMSPIVRHADGSISEPIEEEADLPLGIMDGVDYEQLSIKLQPGESMTMYTDGVNEAMNVSDECYGMDRIREMVTKSDGSPTVIGESIIADVDRFLGADGVQDDDICLVAVRRN